MSRNEKSSWALVAARFLLAFIFVMSGLNKLANLDQAAQYIASQGLPAPALLAVVAGCVEFIAGLSLLLGIGASAGGVLLALYMIPVTLVFHDFWNVGAAERQMQFIQFMKNLAIEGGLIYMAVFGAGEFSLDAWLARHGKLPLWYSRRRPTAV